MALQTDGPHYAQLCHDRWHGHHSPETAKLDNGQWECEFNRVTQICGGYTEDNQAVLVGLDQVTQFRTGLSAHTEQLPPSCRWWFFLIGSIFGLSSMVTDP